MTIYEAVARRVAAPSRVVLVGPFGLSPKGTMSSRALPLARALARRGQQVEMILPTWDAPADAGRAWEDAGVHIRCLSLGGVRRRASPALALRCLRAALDSRPDAICCFKPIGYAGVVGMLARRMGRRRPAVLFDLDDLEGRGGWAGLVSQSRVEVWLREAQERWALRSADALTVASHFLQEKALAAGMPAGRVHLLLNGCEPAEMPVGGTAWREERRRARARFGLAEEELIILWGARPHEAAPARIAAIMARVWASLPQARLLIAGGAAPGLQGPALELGWLAPADWRAAVMAADVGIVLMDDTPLQRARCPSKMPQMLAWGLPLVSDAVGEARTYIDDQETGRLVAPGDEDAFARAVVRLLADDGQRWAYALAAGQRAPARWSWNAQALVFEAALASAGAAAR